MLGLGLSIPCAAVRGNITLAQKVAALFSAGEQGAWYDPSDFSTMFQDAAGTIPVTAVGQAVGLLLDKSKGLVLGIEIKSIGIPDIVGTTTAATYNSTTGEGTATRTDTSNYSWVAFTVTANSYYKITITNTSANSIYIRDNTGGGVVLLIIPAGATVTTYLLSPSGRFAITATANAQAVSFTVTSIKELAGNHATQTTSTKRPVLQKDANGKYYLLFDGIDDALQTASVNFTGTDKVTVWAGVRKLSDAAGSIAELSSTPTAAGSVSRFILSAAGGNTPSYGLSITSNSGTGGTLSIRALTYIAPITNVVSAVYTSSITSGAGRVIPRINATTPSSIEIAFEQGGLIPTTFGNYPIYIGSRGGTTLPFNGRLYSLIVRGAHSTDTQITSTEAYVNSKTQAY